MRFLKAESPLIASVLYLAIFMSGIFIVYSALYPYYVDKKSLYDVKQTYECFLSLNKEVDKIAVSYEGSEAYVSCDLTHGAFFIGTSFIKWVSELKSTAVYYLKGVYDYAYVDEGARIYDDTKYVYLENSLMILNFTNVKNEPYNISKVFIGVFNKKTGQTLNITRILPNQDSFCEYGVVKVSYDVSNNLPLAILRIYFDNDYCSYYVEFKLPDYGDYFYINVVPNY